MLKELEKLEKYVFNDVDRMWMDILEKNGGNTTTNIIREYVTPLVNLNSDIKVKTLIASRCMGYDTYGGLCAFVLLTYYYETIVKERISESELIKINNYHNKLFISALTTYPDVIGETNDVPYNEALSIRMTFNEYLLTLHKKLGLSNSFYDHFIDYLSNYMDSGTWVEPIFSCVNK